MDAQTMTMHRQMVRTEDALADARRRVTALENALKGYVEAWHQPIHPGEPCYEVRVSEATRQAALAVLKGASGNG